MNANKVRTAGEADENWCSVLSPGTHADCQRKDYDTFYTTSNEMS